MSDYTTNDVETYYINEERIQYSTEAWESIQRGLEQTETRYIGSFWRQAMTSEELRAAMESTDRPLEPGVTNEDPEMWAELTEWEAARADTLAAAVRELYEALKAFRAYAEHPVSQDDGYAITCLAKDKLDRYRAALEGDEDDS